MECEGLALVSHVRNKNDQVSLGKLTGVATESNKKRPKKTKKMKNDIIEVDEFEEKVE